jgi:retinol dehydrogenase 12
MADLDGNTVVITGASSGIGAATALALAAQGAKLLLACSSESRAAPVLDELASAGTPALGVTNHVGHFLLTTRLLDALGDGAPRRLVTVASKSHYQAKGIDFDAVRQPTRSMTGLPEYEVSKVANVLFSQEPARRVAGRGIHTYALHPGVITSEIWRNVPRPMHFVMTRFMKSPEDGARTSVYCATLPDVADDTGRYYTDCAVKEPSAAATPDLAAELWSRSEEWTAA